MARALPTGIQRTATGYRAFQWVPWPGYPTGRLRSKRFPATTPLKDIESWREDRRVEARRRTIDTATDAAADAAPIGEGFVADADRYLDARQTMPTFKERRRHIREWARVFGETPTREITSVAIRTQCERWLTVGPKMVMCKPAGETARWEPRPIPLSAHSVNLRLRALENLFTVLYPDADNPVREIAEYDEPRPEAKGQSFALGYEILSFMPDVTKPLKGGTHERGSLTRVRFETMLMTGLTPKQIAALQPEHVNWTAPSVIAPQRFKGRRSRRQRANRAPKPRQLMREAVPVLRRFFALQANTPFSSSSLRQSVLRAIRAANVARATRRLPAIPETLTPYELTRHTFGTEVFRSSKNLLLVKDLMGHADIAQSERYAMAAIQEHQVAAVTELSKVAQRARVATARESSPKPRRPYRGKVSPGKRSQAVRTGRMTEAGKR